MLAALVGGGGGCAASSFDRYFEAGQYELAARAHEADPSPAPSDRTLFRLGLVYALPQTPVYDPTRARASLEALRARFPASRFRTPGRVLLALLTELTRLETEVDMEQFQLDSLRVTLREIQEGHQALRQGIANQDRELERLRRELRRLEDELADKSLTVRRLESELERLKSIDLGRPSP